MYKDGEGRNVGGTKMKARRKTKNEGEEGKGYRY